MKRFQVDDNEIIWRGFLIDKDAEAAAPYFKGASVATAHEDPDIVQEAWDRRRTIVTSNRRDFVRHIQQHQNRENQPRCRDLWGLVVIPNLHLLREKGLSFIRHGLTPVSRVERLGWPGIALLNLYIHLTGDQKLEIRRFGRCSYCERDRPIPEPWNAWYRSLPMVGNPTHPLR